MLGAFDGVKSAFIVFVWFAIFFAKFPSKANAQSPFQCYDIQETARDAVVILKGFPQHSSMKTEYSYSNEGKIMLERKFIEIKGRWRLVDEVHWKWHEFNAQGVVEFFIRHPELITPDTMTIQYDQNWKIIRHAIHYNYEKFRLEDSTKHGDPKYVFDGFIYQAEREIIYSYGDLGLRNGSMETYTTPWWKSITCTKIEYNELGDTVSIIVEMPPGTAENMISRQYRYGKNNQMVRYKEWRYGGRWSQSPYLVKITRFGKREIVRELHLNMIKRTMTKVSRKGDEIKRVISLEPILFAIQKHGEE